MGVDSRLNRGIHNDWGTPQKLFDTLNVKFNFTLDPCCNELNKKCNKYFMTEDDGLTKDWNNNIVFMNPPYSRGLMAKWIKKAYLESLKSNCIVVALIRVSTETNWWHNYVMKAKEIWFIQGRLCFEGFNQALDNKYTTTAPCMHASGIIVFDKSRNTNYPIFRAVDSTGNEIQSSAL